MSPSPPLAHIPHFLVNHSVHFLESLGHPRGVVVVSHANPDPDALASMLGVQEIVRSAWPDCPVALALDGIVARAENQAMVRELRIPLVPIESLVLGSGQAGVMVDSQPGNNARLGLCPCAVLDHHETPGALEGVPFRDIRPGLGATTTIVTNYLRELSVPITPPLATALYYGIESETAGWPRESSPADDDALVYLCHHIDRDLLARIKHPRLSQDYFATYQHALANAFLYQDVIVSYCGVVPQPDIVAELADFFIRFDRVSWSVVCGVYAQGLRVSVRADHVGAHCGELLRESVGGLGSAGGHDRRAGGVIHLPDLEPETIEEAISSLRERILDELGIDFAMGHRLLEQSPHISTP
jgi:nanoRNase/pAp phosphatase (c-di-AMP/oligoRNAs hydrolase)